MVEWCLDVAELGASLSCFSPVLIAIGLSHGSQLMMAGYRGAATFQRVMVSRHSLGLECGKVWPCQRRDRQTRRAGRGGGDCAHLEVGQGAAAVARATPLSAPSSPLPPSASTSPEKQRNTAGSPRQASGSATVRYISVSKNASISMEHWMHFPWVNCTVSNQWLVDI